MHVSIRQGERGSFWFRIRDRKGVTLAVNPTPGFETEAEAREAGEAVIRGKWPKWVPWLLVGKIALLILTFIDQFHTNLGMN